MPSDIHEPKHWRDRAEEARVHAEQMTDPEAKRMMLEIANGYERLAERVAERAAISETTKKKPRL
jgi:hypothetical protein